MTDMSREKLLTQIQMLDFYAVELNLFLDTHPTDSQALQDYDYILKQSARLRDEYERRFGPLLGFHKGRVTTDYWNWISDPWPWENMREA